MSTDWTDPNRPPLWKKKSREEPEHQKPDADTTLAPDGSSVTRVMADLAPEDIKILPDGRRLRLLREIKFEVDGGADLRTQRIYRGPKNLGVTTSLEYTTVGWLRHVSLGYPNHVPDLADIRMIREVFYDEGMEAMWIIPTETRMKLEDPALRNLVSTLEVPKAWTSNPVQR